MDEAEITVSNRLWPELSRNFDLNESIGLYKPRQKSAAWENLGNYAVMEVGQRWGKCGERTIQGF
jgi:hypothetical protein